MTLGPDKKFNLGGQPQWVSIFTAIWTICTAWWSIFTPPDRTYPIRALLFQPAWILRLVRQDCTYLEDILISLGLHAGFSLATGLCRVPSLTEVIFHLKSDALLVYIRVFTLLAVCGALAGLIVYRGAQLDAGERQSRLVAHSPKIDEQLIQPLIIPSRTTHSRLFPQKHSFGYSYLLVGVPVGLRGKVSSSLSIDSEVKAWFHVCADDYLTRSTGQSLAEKLRAYLHTKGITDRAYSFAYLVTAPRFAGYSFNPVSFWYLYDDDAHLRFMILEVNNTFGEKHTYLLRADPASTQLNAEMTESLEKPQMATQKKLVFSDVWAKDFHVSPFNSRNGSYSLRAVDPLAALQDGRTPVIDNTIVLRSSNDNPKIVARVWSHGEHRDASNISGISLAGLIAAWAWVGFMTFPRILWQARTLYFARGLIFWNRPEVVARSVSRTYSADEVCLEKMFHAWLKQAMNYATKPLRLVYRAPHREWQEVVLYSPGFTYQEDHGTTLELKVLTPAFYSRFIHYAHAKEAFDRESLATDAKNCTLIVGNGVLLPILMEAASSMAIATSTAQRRYYPLNDFRWKVLRSLRCPPAAQAYSSKEVSVDENSHNLQDIRTSRYSELDRFVWQECEEDGPYRRIAMKLFLAQRFVYGIPLVITTIDLTIRAVVIFVALLYSSRAPPMDILQPELFGKSAWPKTICSMLLANGVHVWELVKG